MASFNPERRAQLASCARVAAPSVWAAASALLSAWLLLPLHVYVASVTIIGLTGAAQGAAMAGQKLLPRLPGLIWMMLVRAARPAAAVATGALCEAYTTLLLLLLLLLLLARHLQVGLVGRAIGLEADKDASAALRSMALGIILIRAGLGLNMPALRRTLGLCLRLALIPNMAETVVIAGLCVAVFGWPWAWGWAAGFVLSAVSAAVVVPTLLRLQELGYGVEQGIPTTLLAASAIDNVFSISAFGVALAFAVPGPDGGQLWWQILGAPLKLLAGALGGVLLGLVVARLAALGGRAPARGLPAAALLGTGIAAVLGGKALAASGAGALAAVLSGLAAQAWWRAHGTPAAVAALGDASSAGKWIWVWLAQPALFALVGNAVPVRALDLATVGLAAVIIVAASGARFGVVVLTARSRFWTQKDQLFIGMAWIPKATVQAAIGGLALDQVRSQANPSQANLDRGKELLTMAVLVILITAPVGAVAIDWAGERCLRRAPPEVSAAGEQPAPEPLVQDGAAVPGSGPSPEPAGSDEATMLPIEAGEIELTSA